MALDTMPSQDRPATPGADAAGCPRCGQPLVDPTGLGWCKACGYCRSLGGEVGTTTPAAAPGPKKPGVREAGAAIGQVPTWLWVLAFSITVLVLGVYLTHRYIHPKPLPRALWSTIQVGAGIALIFIGQFAALIRLAPDDPNLSFMHALVPGQMYGLIWKHLPRTSVPAYLVCWGKVLIITATKFIGGFDHWFTYLGNGR